jgi:cell division septum initiation protein DivIVA
VITEPAKTFSRMFWGYDPAAVDAHIEMLTTKQQLLLEDVESLRARLKESGDEVGALLKEVAVLTDTSPSPHAMQQRMAKMLRRAVDEVSEMQAEARAEAEAVIAAAESEAQATQRKRDELLADMAAQQKPWKPSIRKRRKSSRPNSPACALMPSRRARSYSPTQSNRLIIIVSRPGGPWTRRVGNGSKSSSN